jgi:hypothetical protein
MGVITGSACRLKEHLVLGNTEEDQVTPLLKQPDSKPRYESRTSRTRTQLVFNLMAIVKCISLCDFLLILSLDDTPAQVSFFVFVYTTNHCNLKAYCAILVRRSNLCHQASPRVSPRDSTQRRKVELWVRNIR